MKKSILQLLGGLLIIVSLFSISMFFYKTFLMNLSLKGTAPILGLGGHMLYVLFRSLPLKKPQQYEKYISISLAISVLIFVIGIIYYLFTKEFIHSYIIILGIYTFIMFCLSIIDGRQQYGITLSQIMKKTV